MRLGPQLPVTAAAAAVILIVDRSIWRSDIPWPVKGACDEAAHVATTALLLAPFADRLDGPFALGALAGSVALDLDHVPIYAGLRPDRGRPGTHSIATVAAVAAAASLPGLSRRRRRLLRGLCAGIASHLVRDAVTGGAPLLWPWSKRVVGVHLAPRESRGVV